MKLYDVTTLTLRVMTNGPTFQALEKSLPDAGGTLLGCWASDIGELSKVMILRSFDTAEELMAARRRLQLGANPLGTAEWLTKLETGTYAMFPFLPDIEPGRRGPVYEMRVYGLKYGALQATIDAWRDAVPGRTALSPLLGAMYALDGETPRFLNIWPYASTNERFAVRGEAFKQGVWPPVGGPANLTTMSSTIYLPAPFSPLQ